MASNRDPNRMFNLLSDMQNLMERLIESSQNLVEIASEFGGEISKVLAEQVTSYYIPEIRALIDDPKKPGSLIGISRFLDSLPLAMARSKRDYTEDIADVVRDTSAVLNASAEEVETPEGSTGVEEGEEGDRIPDHVPVLNTEEIPSNTSYTNPMEGASAEAPAEVARESKQTGKKIRETVQRYFVVRTMMNESALGDMADLKEEVVAEFDDEQLAEARCDYLNKCVTAAEKDFLGTTYSVKKRDL